MTFLQLQYMVKVAQTGSISESARLLFLSQSHLSNAIRSLEKELGLSLFSRNNKGVSLTSDGEIFIEYAQNILDGYDSIMQIGHKKRMQYFSLGTWMPRSYCNNAFAKLCSKYQGYDDVNLTVKEYNNLNAGIDDLMMRLLSAYVIFTTTENDYNIRETCKSKGIKMEPLGTLPLEITVRKGHPLLEGKDLSTIEKDFDFKLVEKFPYVEYAREVFNIGSMREIIWNETHKSLPKPSSNDIIVHNISQKDLVLKSTNAYAFSMSRSPLQIDPGILGIPINGAAVTIYFCTNAKNSKASLINEFQNLLIEELFINPRFKSLSE